MRSRYWIISAASAVAFSAVIANAAAAPIGAATTRLNTTRDDVSALTEGAPRRNYSRTSGRHKGGSNDPKSGSSDPSPSGWYPHDSNKLPFGSALWWQQKNLERGCGDGRS
jgi:hypothetical protein